MKEKLATSKYSNGKTTGGKRKFDLRALEDKALGAYASWTKSDDQATRTAIFTTVRELTLAILHVGSYEKYRVDYDSVAYEYALYLFERIVVKSFKLVGYTGRFPLQHYISMNIKTVIVSKRDTDHTWHELIQDMEFLIDIDEPDPGSELERAVSTGDEEGRITNRMHYSIQIWKILAAYYPREEIVRLLPMSLELLNDNPRHIVNPDLPEDLKDFTVVMVAAAKRMVRQDSIFHATDVKRGALSRALAAAARSTVFLSMVADSSGVSGAFPREFLLALDIDSLYRLVSVMGGKRIRVPTMRQMETLLGSVVAMSKMLLEGETVVDKAVSGAKDDLDLTFSHRFNIHTFISSAMETYNIFGEDKASEPLIDLMIRSIKSLDDLLGTIRERSKTQTNEQLLREYKQLSGTFTNFTESLVRISAGVRSGALVEPEDHHEQQRAFSHG